MTLKNKKSRKSHKLQKNRKCNKKSSRNAKGGVFSSCYNKESAPPSAPAFHYGNNKKQLTQRAKEALLNPEKPEEWGQHHIIDVYANPKQTSMIDFKEYRLRKEKEANKQSRKMPRQKRNKTRRSRKA
jgi:hypothetical protein